tara:strand:+ start:1124 stop:1450 length:327 start_codon:yes stop_codon:yes gene_type:complete
MAEKHYKIIVPKAGASDETGMNSRLYQLDEMVKANSAWLEDLMQVFVKNGWAHETKVDEPVETKRVRARDDDGQYVADDPTTPENEAWVEQPIKKTTKKRGRPKKKVD